MSSKQSCTNPIQTDGWTFPRIRERSERSRFLAYAIAWCRGALKLILEAIFEADFCPNSYGFRPKRSPHRALAEVRRSLMRRMTTVIDVDLAKYFDNVRHDVLLGKIARRVQDPKILHLVKLIIRAGGKKGVPQGGPFSPLAANIY